MGAALHCWTQTLFKVEHGMGVAFAAWGRIVSRHPLSVIIGSLILAIALMSGIPNMVSETNTVKLYSATGTPSHANYKKWLKQWAEYDPDRRWEYIVFAPANVKDTDSNFYTQERLEQLWAIHERTVNITTTDSNGNSYQLEDLCEQSYANNDNCYIQCIFEFMDFDETQIPLFVNNSNQDKFVINPNYVVNYPVSWSTYAEDWVPIFTRAGSPQRYFESDYSALPIINSTPAFRCTYVLDGTKGSDTILIDWEDKFLEMAESFTQDMDIGDEVAIAYNAYKSFDDELTRSVASDVSTFALAFGILSTFAGLLVLRFRRRPYQLLCCKCPFVIDPSRSRAIVGNFGVIAAMLGVGACFGLTGGILGVKFNSVVSVAPFLLLGLGVDDMFVILRSYELTSPKLSVEERIVTTMQRGGVSILFTSVTDLVAFGIGSTSSFGAVSSFCAYCAVGVAFDFLFCISFFLGFMVYDSRWNGTWFGEDSFRWIRCICCCCNARYRDCCKRFCKDYDNNSGSGSGENEKNIELETSGAVGNGNGDGDGAEPATKDNGAASQSMIGHLIEDRASSHAMELLGSFVLKDYRVSLVIMIMFVGYVAGAVYGLTTLTSFEDPVDLAPNDSYLRDFYSYSETYFNEIGPAMLFSFDKELDYSDSMVQGMVLNFTEEVEDDDCFGYPDLTVSWLAEYLAYIESKNITINNQTHWYYVLYTEFLNTEEGSNYIVDIWETITLETSSTDDALRYEYFNGSYIIVADYDAFEESSYSSSISNSRIYAQMKSVGFGAEIIAGCLPFLHSVTADHKKDLGSYYYFEATLFAETAEVAESQTIFNVTLASCAAFLICLFLIPFPSVAIFVSYAVAQILIGVMGYMSLWGLAINTTSMINIVISVGFSVDNTAHFCHAYMIAPIKRADLERKRLSHSYLDEPRIADNFDKRERHERCLFALNSVGVPILAGDFSTICALLPLAAAQSAIFVSFFKILFLVMLFGALHAVLFLPIVFSVIGPVGVEQDETETETGTETSKQMDQSIGSSKTEIQSTTGTQDTNQ